MIAAEMTRIENAIKDGTATSEDIFAYVEAKVERAADIAFINAQNQLLESEMHARMEKDKLAAQESRLHLEELTFAALERLENVE